MGIASTTGKVVLVTGTAGFVGFHTALALKKRGDGVLGIDNFNPYYPVGLKRDRAATLEKAGVLTLEMDLNDGEQLKGLMDECKFTHILALAAQAGVRYATKHPRSYVSSNIAGFVELLEVARNADPMPRIVYASSSSAMHPPRHSRRASKSSSTGTQRTTRMAWTRRWLITFRCRSRSGA